MPHPDLSNDILLGGVHYVPGDLVSAMQKLNIRTVATLLSMNEMDRQFVGKLALASGVELEVCRDVLEKLTADYPHLAIEPDKTERGMGHLPPVPRE